MVETRPDFLALVDPELREAALTMRATTAAFTPMTMAKLATRRQWASSGARPLVEGVSFTEQFIDRPAWSEGPPVGVIVVNARPGARGPGLFHIHGGGFTASTARAGLGNVQALARALDMPVVSLDYRLAPETPWPGALEDGLVAYGWMQAQAAAIGVDPARIGLLGESAGGGHAALLALTLRDRGEAPPPACQALVYPMLDDRTGSSRRIAAPVGYFGWNEAANRFGWNSYLGQAPGRNAVPPAAVPARAASLAGLPPSWIGIGSLDLFVGENLAYAARLIAAGVPTELTVVPGAFHGFDVFMPDAAVSRRFSEAKIAALRRMLG